MPDIQQSLLDFDATIKAKPNLTTNELMAKFPEFNNDPKLLQAAHDYSATLNAGKYDQPTLNSKFPEFFGQKTPMARPEEQNFMFPGVPKNQSSVNSDQSTVKPLTNKEAKKTIYGEMPGVTKIGDVSILPTGGGYQNTKGKANVEELPAQIKEVSVPTQSVYGDAPQLKVQTITTDPDAPVNDYVPNEYEKAMFKQAQTISKGVTEQEFKPQFYKDVAQGAINSLAGIGGSSLKGIGDITSKTESLAGVDFFDSYGKTIQDLGEKASNYARKNSNDSPGQKIGGLLPLAGAAVADIASGGALTPAITGVFAASGYGDGLEMYDEVNKGKETNEYARTGAGLLYGAVMAGAANYLVGKTIPKGILSEAVQSVFKSNPELLRTGGEAVMNSFAKAQPSIVKQLMRNTLHGVGTMEAMDLSKNAIDEIYGKHHDLKEWINTATEAAVTGAIFSGLTSPFSIHAQSKANIERRNAQGQVAITFDEKGKPVEILSGNKGLTPEGKEVTLSENSLNNAYSMTTTDFNNALKQYASTGKATINERDVFSNKVTGTLTRLANNGNVTVARDENGNALYVIGKNNDGLMGMDVSGNVVNIPKESPMESANIADVHQSILHEYDKRNAFYQEPTYQQAISNPESIVNPTIPTDVDVMNPQPHIETGIKAAEAKRVMDEQLNGLGIQFDNTVLTLDPEVKKQVLADVMNDTQLNEPQKQSIINYLSTTSKSIQLENAAQEALTTKLQQAQQQVEKSVNPTTGTLVTARIKGGDENESFPVISGLAVTKDESKQDQPWMVDPEKSEQAVYYKDADGKTQVTTADNMEVVSNTTPDEQLAMLQEQYAQEDAMRQQAIQSAVSNQQLSVQTPNTQMGDSDSQVSENGDQEVANPLVNVPIEELESQLSAIDDALESGVLNDEQANELLKQKDVIQGAINSKQSAVSSEQSTVSNDQLSENSQENPSSVSGQSGDVNEQVTTVDNTPQYPVLEDGTPDFDNFSDEQLFNYNREQFGEEAALTDLKDEIKAVEKQIATKDKAILKAGMKDRVKLRTEAKELSDRLNGLNSLLTPPPSGTPLEMGDLKSQVSESSDNNLNTLENEPTSAQESNTGSIENSDQSTVNGEQSANSNNTDESKIKKQAEQRLNDYFDSVEEMVYPEGDKFSGKKDYTAKKGDFILNIRPTKDGYQLFLGEPHIGLDNIKTPGQIESWFPTTDKEFSNNIDSAIELIEKYSTENTGVDQQIAEQEHNTNPTELQKLSGGYEKPHVVVNDMPIQIENAIGHTRSGVDEDGKAWEHVMKSHYGDFIGTKGYDGDPIDVFVKSNTPEDWNGMVYVVDQVKTTSPQTALLDERGEENPSASLVPLERGQSGQEKAQFDESKVMIGYDTPEEAKDAYMENYDPDWKGFSSITPVAVDDFKKWLYDGAKQRKPFSEYVENKPLTPEGEQDDAVSFQINPNEIIKNSVYLRDDYSSVEEKHADRVSLVRGIESSFGFKESFVPTDRTDFIQKLSEYATSEIREDEKYFINSGQIGGALAGKNIIINAMDANNEKALATTILHENAHLIVHNNFYEVNFDSAKEYMSELENIYLNEIEREKYTEDQKADEVMAYATQALLNKNTIQNIIDGNVDLSDVHEAIQPQIQKIVNIIQYENNLYRSSRSTRSIEPNRRTVSRNSTAVGRRKGPTKPKKSKGTGISSNEEIPDAIDIDGKQRSTTNSLGKPIHGTEEGIRNFYKWFGDSQVVDESGRPLVVYHGGASKVTKFDTEKAGTVKYSDWGNGIYFTPSEGYADMYRADYAKSSDKIANRLYDEYVEVAKSFGTTPMDKSIDLSNETEKLNQLKKLEYKWRDRLDKIKNTRGEVYPVYLNISNPMRYRYEGMTDPFLSQTAKDGGNDGIIVTPMTEYVVFSPNQIKSATGNDGSFSPDDTDIRYQILGENGAKALDETDASTGSATSRLNDLRVAKEMEATKTPQEIRLATGWEKGVDGKWRYEVADGKLSGTLTSEPVSLSEVWSDEQLFTAYPQLKGIKINVEPFNGKYSAMNFPDENKITVYQSRNGSIPQSANSFITHEIQHSIQEIEGFSLGSNIDNEIDKVNAKANNLTFEEYKDAISSFETELENKKQELDQINNSKRWNKSWKASGVEVEINKLKAELKKLINTTASEQEAFENYRKSAGEVEARNVQSRLELTPEERRNTLLAETADIVPENQLLEITATKPKYSASLSDYAAEIVKYNDEIKAIEDRKKVLKKQHEDKQISNLDFSKEVKSLNEEKFDIQTKVKRIEAGTSKPEDFEPIQKPKTHAEKLLTKRNGAKDYAMRKLELLAHNNNTPVDLSLTALNTPENISHNLEVAKTQENNGTDGETVLNTTGWIKNETGTWEFPKYKLEENELPLYERNFYEGLDTYVQKNGNAGSLKANIEEYVNHINSLAREKAIGLEAERMNSITDADIPEYDSDKEAEVLAKAMGSIDELEEIERKQANELKESIGTSTDIDFLMQQLKENRKKQGTGITTKVKIVAQEVSDYIRVAVGKDIVDVMSEREFKSLINKLETATSTGSLRTAMKAVNQTIQQIVVRKNRAIIRGFVNGKILNTFYLYELDAAVRTNNQITPEYSNLIDNDLMNTLSNLNSYNRYFEIQGKNKQGVSIARNVDEGTRQIMQFVRDYKDLSREQLITLENELNEQRSELNAKETNKLPEESKAAHNRLLLQNERKQIAIEQLRRLADIKDIESDIKLLKDTDWQDETFRGEKAKWEVIIERQKDLERVQMESIRNFATLLDTGRNLLTQWKQNEQKHNDDIASEALAAVTEKSVKTQAEEKANPTIKRRSLLSTWWRTPLTSFEFMLSNIDRNHPTGEGPMYRRWMPELTQASDKFYNGYNKFRSDVKQAVQEIFGMKLEDFTKDTRKDSGIAINYKVADSAVEGEAPTTETIQMTKGELMYVWLTWQHADGREKLEAMNITDADIKTIAKTLGDNYIEFAKWTQNYLNESREKYNETHNAVFGTSMGKIHNYFPLKYAEKDLTPQGTVDEINPSLPSTMTGAIINRVRTKKHIKLDENFLDTLMEHGEKMESWNAYAKLRKDLNVLLKNKEFRNRMEANNTGLFEDFENAAKIAVDANQLRPTDVETAFVNVTRRLQGAAIAGRINTALKQSTAAVSYVFYNTDPKYYAMLAKNLKDASQVAKTIAWAKENLPTYAERVGLGNFGNEKLLLERWENSLQAAGKDKRTGKVGRAINKVSQAITEKGMLPNKWVDGFIFASGSHAIYEYEKQRYVKAGFSDSEAEQRALFDAANYSNKVSQSSNPAYLAPVQKSKTWWAQSFTTFMNSQFAFGRNVHEGVTQLYRAVKQIPILTSENEAAGMNPEEAKKQAQKTVINANGKSVLKILYSGLIANFIFQMFDTVFSSIISGGGGNDEDEKQKKIIDAAWKSPLSNIFGGSNIISVIEGYDPKSLLDSETSKAVRELKSTVKDGFSTETAKLAIQYAIKFSLGLNVETLANIYTGIEKGIIEKGGAVMAYQYITNVPKSVREETAKNKLIPGESIAEFAKRISDAKNTELKDADLKEVILKKVYSDNGDMSKFNRLNELATEWEKLQKAEKDSEQHSDRYNELEKMDKDYVLTDFYNNVTGAVKYYKKSMKAGNEINAEEMDQDKKIIDELISNFEEK